MMKIVGLASLYEPLEFLENRIRNLNQCDMDGVLVYWSDCSPEATWSEVERIVKDKCRFAHRIDHHSERKTLYWTWNWIIERSMEAGELSYFTNVNVDDIHHPSYFTRMSAYLDANPEKEIVGCAWIATDVKGQAWPPVFSGESQCDPSGTLGHFPMWRASLHKRIGLFHPEMLVHGDSDFSARVRSNFGLSSIGSYPESLGCYLTHEKNLRKTARGPDGRSGEAYDRMILKAEERQAESDLPKPVFLRPKKEYGSYRDFWELVRLSGFRSILAREADFRSDTVYIYAPLFNPALFSSASKVGAISPPERKAKVIGWELERMEKKWRPHEGNMAVLDRVWVSDKGLLGYFPGSVHAVLGSHHALALEEDGVGAYDLCHFSTLSGRRRILFRRLEDKGIRMAPTGWGEERAAIIRSSRAMLNVHKTSMLIGEPLRFALAAAYGIPLLSETLRDPWPLEPGRDLLMESYERLEGAIPIWLKREDLSSVGDSFRKKLTVEFTFRRCVMDALRRSFK